MGKFIYLLTLCVAALFIGYYFDIVGFIIAVTAFTVLFVPVIYVISKMKN